MTGQLSQTERMRRDASQILRCGIAAAASGDAVRRFCRRQGRHLRIGEKRFDLSRYDRVLVVGAGKASAAMAAALEALLGDRLSEGCVVVKYGHTAPLGTIRQIEAGHPVPDRNGEKGAGAILELLGSAGKNDLVLCLLSGGGSALAPLPAPGLSLEDKQAMSRILLGCGATIHEINALRKHTSGIKGGRMAAAAYPAEVVALILSDVVGDDLDVIASGPTVPDSSSFADCLTIIDTYRLRETLPRSIVHHIEAGAAGRVPETPDAADPSFDAVLNLIIGSNIDALKAAEAEAGRLGYHCLILSSMVEGETRHVARVHGAIAREIRKTGHPVEPPACILSGGETTVTLSGDGKGGRNQEFALAAAVDIADLKDIVILSAGTDGTDGPTDAAGAVADTTTAARGKAAGLDPSIHLAGNNAYPFFRELGDLVFTGPTDTNVMDLRIVLVR